MPPLDLMAWGLVGLWALFLASSFALKWWIKPTPRIPYWPRLASSLILVGLAWYGYLLAETPSALRYAVLIAAGMSLGFIGDLFMASVLPSPNRLVGGMAAFGLGHLLYIAAIASYHPVNWIVLFIWLAVGALFFYLVVLRSKEHRSLQGLILAYALLLSATAGVATSLALYMPRFTGLALGAALFLISDLLIALDLFSQRRFPALNHLVWLTYGPGQALIVTSIWSTFQPGGPL